MLEYHGHCLHSQNTTQVANESLGSEINYPIMCVHTYMCTYVDFVSVSLCVYVSVCMSVCPSVCVSVSVCLSVCVHVFISDEHVCLLS